MPNDATEGVAKHSYMLQTLINFHAPGIIIIIIIVVGLKVQVNVSFFTRE